MRASRLHIVTLREDPADAEIASHRLLLRAGFMYKSGAGLYVYGPLLQRVIDAIRRIVAEEISAAGGLEITMPILQEQSLWERSGRWAAYQATRTMLTTTDRGGTTFGLAPTAEEVVTDYARAQVSSHKQLPVCYFQQHTKFRDEIRPRFGLMRVKEFIMMDAYSFHADEECLVDYYQTMKAAYHRIFQRCGLESYAVEADSGAIGGTGSHEFMVAADVGEDAILFGEDSGYAANVETARTHLAPAPSWSAPQALALVDTPNAGSIEAVVTYLQTQGYADVHPAHLCKMVLLMADSDAQPVSVAVAIRGDRQINEVKVLNALTRALGADAPVIAALRPMQEAEVRQASGARPGFAGPLAGLQVDVLLVDEQLPLDAPLICGANSDDQHQLGVIWQRDVTLPYHRADVLLAEDGDPDPNGKGILRQRRGIEVGHIFQLGTKYSSALGAQFNGADGKLHTMTMGCYGIGTSRLAAAAIEQYHDERGMRWPLAIAPYHCVVVPAKGRDAACVETAEQLMQDLRAAGVDAILDDRDCGPGVKFKDWELIGIPLTVVCGRGLADGLVEVKHRHDGRSEDVPLDTVVEQLAQEVRAATALA
ncbi:MAG: proline--tRNA ligase [Planctomycetota bacterium]|nr:MAG: proline--tRNA ligase [Planctomycetota bacterium]